MGERDVVGGFEALRASAREAPVGGLVPFPAAARASTPAGSFLELLRMDPTHVGYGRARAAMELGEVHRGPAGAVAPSALVAFADAVAGWAMFAIVDQHETYTTLQLTTEFVVPAGAHQAGTRVVAEARPVEVGPRTCVFEVEVRSAGPDARLVARFACTQLRFAR